MCNIQCKLIQVSIHLCHVNVRSLLHGDQHSQLFIIHSGNVNKCQMIKSNDVEYMREMWQGKVTRFPWCDVFLIYTIFGLSS